MEWNERHEHIEIFIIKAVGKEQYMTVEHDYMLSKHQTRNESIKAFD
jgi:hypothetical protein